MSNKWYDFATIPGLSLHILKRESWTHVGRTANTIIKDVIHIFASISKTMRILLMGRRNRERWILLLYGSGHEGVAVLLPGFAINW